MQIQEWQNRVPADVVEPIPVDGQPYCQAQHKKEMLRYLFLVIALLAVVLLISIALYYTQGNSVTIEHVGSLTPWSNFDC